MSEFVQVATTAELPPGSAKVVAVQGEEIALYNVDGVFYATQNNCLHRQGPLGEGMMDGETVTCPWHGWRYNVKTGENLLNPSLSLKTYPVRIDGDNVLLEI